MNGRSRRRSHEKSITERARARARPVGIAELHGDGARASGVAKLRHRLGLSQAAFARAFGLDVTALHAWSKARRRPDRAARILLAVIAKEPHAVLRALAD